MLGLTSTAEKNNALAQKHIFTKMIKLFFPSHNNHIFFFSFLFSHYSFEEAVQNITAIDSRRG